MYAFMMFQFLFCVFVRIARFIFWQEKVSKKRKKDNSSEESVDLGLRVRVDMFVLIFLLESESSTAGTSPKGM